MYFHCWVNYPFVAYFVFKTKNNQDFTSLIFLAQKCLGLSESLYIRKLIKGIMREQEMMSSAVQKSQLFIERVGEYPH